MDHADAQQRLQDALLAPGKLDAIQADETPDGLRLSEPARRIETAVATVLAAGWRTADVREAAVIGVADARRGQVPQAWIVAPHATPELAAALQAHVRERLGRHEFPRLVEFVDALPRTPAGKVDRQALRVRARPA